MDSDHDHGDQGGSSGKTCISPEIHQLYRAAASSDYEKFKRLFKRINDTALPVTSARNTILHTATKFKQKKVVKLIVYSRPSLVYEKNSKDETSLHIAARLGCLDIANLLLYAANDKNRETEAGEKLTRMLTLDKDTTLHVAVRHGHFEIVKLLVEEDPELTNQVNSAGESPLFLAVDRDFLHIAAYLLQVTENRTCPHRGRDNINVLHATVIRMHKVNQINTPAGRIRPGYYWRCLLHFLQFIRQIILKNFGELNSVEADFMIKLLKRYPSAIEETDNFGWTPLHYAAHLGHWQTVKQFLSTCSNLAYVQDKEGISVLHIAAHEGHVKVMKILIDEYPDICNLLDKEGRTALHVAAENGRIEVVKYVLKTPSLECLINEQDYNGNLPIHLATIHGHWNIVGILERDSRIDKGAVNKEGLAVIDIIQSSPKLQDFEKDRLTRFIQEAGGLPSLRQVVLRGTTGGHNTETEKSGEPPEPEMRENELGQSAQGSGTMNNVTIRKGIPTNKRKYPREHLNNIAYISLLEATIIATVAFQAGFQMPGGFGDQKPSKDSSALVKSPLFMAFLIADSLAFVSSAFSMSIHFWATTRRNQKHLEQAIQFANVFTYFSILALATAFIAGTSAVLPEGQSAATFYIGCSFFLLHSYFFISK